MAKIVKYGNEVTEKLLAGVEKTADIVSKTMGPVAENIIISEYGRPRVTKDGITVIKSVQFEDKFEDAAAQMIREASDKTNTQSGDGTTGTAILLRQIFRNGLKHTNTGGNKIQIRDGIVKAADKVVEVLKSKSKPIVSKEDIRNVAKISSNHSDEIADVLSDVFDKIGTRGVIKVETGNTTETVSKIVDGCQYDVGYLSPYFCTNDKMEADLDNPFTFFCEKKLSNVQEMLPLLQQISKTGRPLFIMCEDMEGEALSTILLNKLRGFQVCVVRCPSYGDNRKAILQDLSILTHSRVVSDDTGVKVSSATIESGIVGQAKRIIVTKDATTIIGGVADKEEIQARVKQIDVMIEQSKEQWEKDKLEERRAKLDGGIAVVSVGGKTESELKEKKDLVDDAFNAVKAAIKNGIVPGGGTALLYAKRELGAWFETAEFKGDERIGAKVLIDALDAPARTILENAGESSDLIVSKLLEADAQEDYGYDVLGRRYCRMLEAGIIDPTSVIISEVENASSIGGLLLTSAGIIVDKPEENKAQMPGGMGGGMPGMM